VPTDVPTAVPSFVPPTKPTIDQKLLDLKKKEELFQKEKSTKPPPFTKESMPDPTGSSDPTTGGKK
jgi:hypothetical protein